MFPSAYFAPRSFAPRYFPKVGAEARPIDGRFCLELAPRSAGMTLRARSAAGALSPRAWGATLAARSVNRRLVPRSAAFVLPERPECPPGVRMIITRQFIDGTIGQGRLETIAYYFTSTPWGTAPTVLDVIVTDQADQGDHSATALVGTASIAGDVVTLPGFGNDAITAGHTYRLDVQFTTADGNTWQAYQIIVVSQ
jgi:hypothetical protein